ASSRASSADSRLRSAPRWARSLPPMSLRLAGRPRRRGLSPPTGMRASKRSYPASARRMAEARISDVYCGAPVIVSPLRPSSLERLFRVSKPLIGDIHLAPLPGTPRYRPKDMEAVAAGAIADAKAYEKGGMDGVIVENHGDIPFLKPEDIGPEIIAAMAVIAKAVRDAVSIPCGINLLANAVIGALAVAKASGAKFIRVNQW